MGTAYNKLCNGYRHGTLYNSNWKLSLSELLDKPGHQSAAAALQLCAVHCNTPIRCSIFWRLITTHFPVFTKLSIKQTPLPPGLFSLHRLHSVDHSDSFLDDLTSSSLNQSSEISWLSLNCLQYHSFILLDKHAPVITDLSK